VSQKGECYRTLAALTQLQELTLYIPFIEHRRLSVLERTLHPSVQGGGPAQLSQLTRLTALLFPEGTDDAPPALWQSQLASALTALTSLQRLQLPRVWEGPVAGALGQMAGLTQLVVNTRQQALAGGLTLPRVQVLKVRRAELRFTAALRAPQLRLLQGYSDMPVRPVFRLQLPGGDLSTKQQGGAPPLTMLEQCAQGVLRCCNSLGIEGNDGISDNTAEAALQVLGRAWRPDPSLVDGSSPHGEAQNDADNRTGVRKARRPEGSDGWRLELRAWQLSRRALAALPQGLTHLELQ
jgi:hypothetical protein